MSRRMNSDKRRDSLFFIWNCVIKSFHTVRRVRIKQIKILSSQVSDECWKIDNKICLKYNGCFYFTATWKNFFLSKTSCRDMARSVSQSSEIWYNNIFSVFFLCAFIRSIITKWRWDARERGEYVAMILSSIWAQSHKFFSYVQNISRKHKFALKWVVKQKHHQSLNEHGKNLCNFCCLSPSHS